MSGVLITAFEPFGEWQSNSSWLTLVELTRELPKRPEVTTRLYPVDYDPMRQRLLKDLASGFDIVLHLGQAAGSSCIQLETVALNLASDPAHPVEACRPLVPDGPMAYRSELPAEEYRDALWQAGIPVQISYHAGTYLCNAALYLTHHYIATNQLSTRAMLLHLPLDASQVVQHPSRLAFMPTSTCVQALRLLLQRLA